MPDDRRRPKMIVVELTLAEVDGKTLPLMFIPEKATPEDRALVDRWRVAAHDLKGYTAVAHWPDAPGQPHRRGPTSSASNPKLGASPSLDA